MRRGSRPRSDGGGKASNLQVPTPKPPEPRRMVTTWRLGVGGRKLTMAFSATSQRAWHRWRVDRAAQEAVVAAQYVQPIERTVPTSLLFDAGFGGRLS